MSLEARIEELGGVEAHVLYELEVVAPAAKTFRLAAADLTIGTAYHDEVLADLPSSYWRLDDASGATAIDAMGAFNGAYSGGYALGVDGPLAGGGSRGVRFDGVNGEVTCGDVLDMIGVDAISLEFWTRPEAFNAATPFIDKLSANGNYRILCGTNRIPVFQARATDNTLNAVAGGATAVLKTGEWNHVVATLKTSTTTARIYLNGVLVGSTSLFTVTRGNTAVALRFGRSNNSGTWLTGAMALTAIYQSELSADRVAAHYLAALSGVAWRGLVLSSSGVARASAIGGRGAGGVTLTLADGPGTYGQDGGAKRFSAHFVEPAPGYGEPYDLRSARLRVKLAVRERDGGWSTKDLGLYKLDPGAVRFAA